MTYGERYTRNRYRCNRQCPRASSRFVCGVAICTQHYRALKPNVPFHYVQLQSNH
jgi:hypothetical protein